MKKWDARFPSTKLTWKYTVLHKVSISNWMFKENTAILTKYQVIMIYRLGKELPVNLGQFVMKTSNDVNGSILHPIMIFQVLKIKNAKQNQPRTW